jgi:2-oxoglutarate ferredoxin oxidoreductase subunit beta
VELAGHPLKMAEILSRVDGSGYIVRRSLHDPASIRKAKKAIRLAFETQVRELGFSMVELLSSCPTNWGMNPQDALDFVRDNMVPMYPLGDYKVLPEIAKLRV